MHHLSLEGALLLQQPLERDTHINGSLNLNSGLSCCSETSQGTHRAKAVEYKANGAFSKT